MDACGFEFIIKDKNGETLIHRKIGFNVPISAILIDSILAAMFLRLFGEMAMKTEEEETDESGTIS